MGAPPVSSEGEGSPIIWPISKTNDTARIIWIMTDILKESLRRLGNLGKKLQREPNLLARYDDVILIQDQLATGIVERGTSEPVGREFYKPHKPVIRESAKSTKLRIVYDASAKANEKSPSLTDCLETGPSLQNLLWDVLVRNRLKPIALAGDLKQAFLQVRISQKIETSCGSTSSRTQRRLKLKC